MLVRGTDVAGAVIYGLIDPSEPTRVRYVGKTNRPAPRLGQHIADALNASRGAKDMWIRELARQGRYPDMVLLEWVSDGAEGRELWWYTRLRDEGQADLNGCVPTAARDFPDVDEGLPRAAVRRSEGAR